MRSPAAAVAWEFRRRYRWALAALALYLALLATAKLVVFGPGQRAAYDGEWQFALMVLIPLSAIFMYLLAVFSFGLSGDLAARESMYPARMFTRPVSSTALAGWPMLYGTVTVALLWLATRYLAVWPAEADIPRTWPALYGAVMLAWTQVLMWTAYTLRGLRVALTILWMTVIGFAYILVLHLEASEAVMLALLAPHLPVAFLAARFAVVRARHGEVPDWRLGGIRKFLLRHDPGRKQRWLSPGRAQVWLEWRRHGRSLPVLVGVLLPFELSLLFFFGATSVFVFETLIAVALTPPFMATFVAATVRSSEGGRDAYELTPFIAARPMTDTALVKAKLEATLRSTVVTWLLVLVAVPLALELSQTRWAVADLAQNLIEIFGVPRAVVLALLVLAVLVASTWKQLVQSLYIGVSGRAWMVKASVFATLALLTLLVPLVPWVLRRSEVVAALWDALPWILAFLVVCKLSSAAWIAPRLLDSGLVGERTLIAGAFSWSATVLALYGALLWVLPTVIFRAYLLALAAILAVPLARLSAAPLALSWNRHR